MNRGKRLNKPFTFKDFLKKVDENGKLEELREFLDYKMDLRFCDICGKAFREGYYDGDVWGFHYCSDECLHTRYTPEEWEEAYGDGETENYWSEWDGDREIVKAYNEYFNNSGDKESQLL